jgi:hypothetical protein
MASGLKMGLHALPKHRNASYPYAYMVIHFRKQLICIKFDDNTSNFFKSADVLFLSLHTMFTDYRNSKTSL